MAAAAVAVCLLQLPNNVLYDIMHRLPGSDLVSVKMTSPQLSPYIENLLEKIYREEIATKLLESLNRIKLTRGYSRARCLIGVNLITSESDPCVVEIRSICQLILTNFPMFISNEYRYIHNLRNSIELLVTKMNNYTNPYITYKSLLDTISDGKIHSIMADIVNVLQKLMARL